MTNNDAAIDAALRGSSICRLLSYQTAAHIAAGTLLRVLGEYKEASMPIHVIHREGRLASAKTHAFVDLMVERLRAEPSLQ